MQPKGLATVTVFGIWCSAIAPPTHAAATVGPAPVVEAIITYRRPKLRSGRPPEEIWHKHGEFVRIDIGATNWLDKIFQQYTRPGQVTEFELLRNKDGEWQSLYVTTDRLSALPTMVSRTFSGATENRLGEICRVWQVVHKIGSGDDFVQSGCVTDKGIELWFQQATIDKIVATNIVYTPVAENEVRPPLEALSVESWWPMANNAIHRNDYQVELRSQKLRSLPPFEYSILRTRSGVWELTTRTGYGLSLQLRSSVSDMSYDYWRSPDNKQSLTIHRHRGIYYLPKRYHSRPIRLGRDKFLGTMCRWWNTQPNGTEGQNSECITPDGILLASSTINSPIAGSPEYRAIALTRSRQPLLAVMPPEHIGDPANWGF